VRKIRFFDHPLYSAHVNARKRNSDQPSQGGGIAVNLETANMPQIIASNGKLGSARAQFSARNAPFPCCACARVPKGILGNPSNQRKQTLALTSPTWARGLSRVLGECACPRGAKVEGLSPRFRFPGPLPLCTKTPKSRIPAFPQNLVKWLPTHARAWGKSDFSTTRTIRACKSNSAQAEARS
jgi:hypothetical protein